MYIISNLERSIKLSDANEIYQADIDALLIEKLKQFHIGKCHQSILITDIVKIIRRSSIIMSDNRLDGSAYIDVRFQVKGIVCVAGEILHGCKIIEIHSNAITAEHKYAGIKLMKDPTEQISNILKVGQKIPIIVQKVRYNPNHTAISMLAIPYTPIVSSNIYYEIKSSMNMTEIEKLGFMFEEIKKEEELHSDYYKVESKVESKVGQKLNERVEFFKDILYPYRNNQKYELGKIATSYNFQPIELQLEKLLSINKGIICYPSEDNKINRRLFWSNTQEKIPHVTIISCSLYPILADITNKYLMYLQALRGFVETYNNQDKIDELNSYWKVCKSLKV